jgi:hypothetical protein
MAEDSPITRSSPRAVASEDMPFMPAAPFSPPADLSTAFSRSNRECSMARLTAMTSSSPSKGLVT